MLESLKDMQTVEALVGLWGNQRVELSAEMKAATKGVLMEGSKAD
jgi:hypothetical protein